MIHLQAIVAAAALLAQRCGYSWFHPNPTPSNLSGARTSCSQLSMKVMPGHCCSIARRVFYSIETLPAEAIGSSGRSKERILFSSVARRGRSNHPWQMDGDRSRDRRTRTPAP